MTKPNMSFRVDPEVADEIRELAARERRRPGQFLANLIEDALAARRALTAESLLRSGERGIAA